VDLSFYTSYLSEEIREEGRAQGRIQGRAEGYAQGRAENILLVLEQRGIDVPFADRQRIRHCGDLGRLRTWFIRAITATSAADVIRDE
jgi:hypothetical protein